MWFSNQLRYGWERPDGDPVDAEILGSASGGPAVLANCLDPVYGHAVLKLLGVQRLLERGNAAVIALVPAALVPIVPNGVAETWLVRTPVRRLFGWVLELEEWVAEQLARFEDCRLAALPPHPHPSSFDLGRFVGEIDAERPGQPSVVLSLRPDRRWGANSEAESANVAELVARLRAAYPLISVTAVGAAEPGGLPDVVSDLRRMAPGESDERRWIGLMRGADLAVGVHGSNLVLASGLARATVELLPSERLGNFLQASVVIERDPLLALDRHRTIYGDALLDDITGARVADVAIAVLDGGARLEALMTGPAAGVGHGKLALPPKPERRMHERGPTRARRRGTSSGRRPGGRVRSLALWRGGKSSGVLATLGHYR